MKRNTLTTAVLAGLTGMAGMVSVSNATGVHVNPEGHGQALIYPFYTARGGNDTLISIVNTHERGKAVKVRFREALNSREVLDFHLYMSPFDVWTAAVTSNDAGGATLFTNDTSCTVPAIPPGPDGGVDFLDFDYNQAAVIGTGTAASPQFKATFDGPAAIRGIERTASGYIEVIEMASMVEGVKPAANATAPAEGNIEWAAKHVEGVPNSCAALVDAWTTYPTNTATSAKDTIFGQAWIDNRGFGLAEPKGGLFGAASIINVDAGTMFSFNAVALENFWKGEESAEKRHAVPGIDAPNLSSTDNTTSHVLFGGVMVDQTFDLGVQAVTAALAQSAIFNEYVTDASIGAQTEWVVTFPTKRYHTDPATVIAPFTQAWTYAASSNAKPACESFELAFWDREEESVSEAPGSARPPVFSPSPNIADSVVKPDFTLCSEANVIAFSDVDAEVGAASGILAEPARADGLGFVNFGLPFDSGWAEIDLVTSITEGTGGVDRNPRGREMAQANVTTGDFGEEAVIQGLPVVGFAVTTYTNGELASGALANYGGTFNHRGSRSITSSAE